MIIYANGDSHMYGICADNNSEFINILSNTLSADLINDALPGASNDRIIRTSNEYLKLARPDLVIIGWTTWERVEVIIDGNHVNFSAGKQNFPSDKVASIYKQWVTEQSFETLKKHSEKWHQRIFDYHCYLLDLKIPHLFFNSFYNFFVEEDQFKDWSKNFIEPYKNEYSYYWYLKSQGEEPDPRYHYGNQGHQIWANFLKTYIEENHDSIFKW